MNNEINFSEMLFNRDERLLDYITNLQEKVEQYENPDDMTLFYMWLDEKAKDKMKELENEVMMLKQQNTMITTLGEDYKSRCEKAIEYIKTKNYRFEFTFDAVDRHEIVCCEKNFVKDLLNILNGDDKSE